jgi:hypothetical protein
MYAACASAAYTELDLLSAHTVSALRRFAKLPISNAWRALLHRSARVPNTARSAQFCNASDRSYRTGKCCRSRARIDSPDEREIRAGSPIGIDFESFEKAQHRKKSGCVLKNCASFSGCVLLGLTGWIMAREFQNACGRCVTLERHEEPRGRVVHQVVVQADRGAKYANSSNASIVWWAISTVVSRPVLVPVHIIFADSIATSCSRTTADATSRWSHR